MAIVIHRTVDLVSFNDLVAELTGVLHQLPNAAVKL
jgi:hypothetical protein